MVTIINLIVVMVVAGCMYSGWKNGFLWKLISLLGFFVVSILAWNLAVPLSRSLPLFQENMFSSSVDIMDEMLYSTLNNVAWFLLFLVAGNLFLLVLKPIAKMVQKVPVVSWLNKAGGLLLGGVQALFFMLAAFLLTQLLFWTSWPILAQESLLKHSVPLCDQLLFYLKEPIKELQKYEKSLQEIKISKQTEMWLHEIQNREEGHEK